MSEKKCVCGHELESRGYQVLELHGESLLKDYMDVELWVCPRCGRIAFFMREKDRKDRYRAECGGRSYLLDRMGVRFPVRCKNGCSFVLNSRPLWLADKLNDIRNVDYGLLWFTDESKEECARVISDYRRGGAPQGEFTRGLYYKGVL